MNSTGATKCILITGANGRIGYQAAPRCAARARLPPTPALVRGAGALAPRNPGSRCCAGAAQPGCARCGTKIRSRELQGGRPLRLLSNNAGLMAPPRRLATAEVFVRKFDANVVGISHRRR